MHLLVFFLTVLVCCEQGNAATYRCDTNAPCGCSAPSTVLSRIVGGEEAARGTWSWAVSIRMSGSHFCGGAILSPNFIITAAHCAAVIENLQDITIQVGSITLVPSASNTVYQVRSIAQVYSHPNYDPFTYENDISIFRLSSPLNMTRGNLKPICLPNGNTVEPPDNINMIAVGWGHTTMNAEEVSPVLRQVTIQSIASTTSACRAIIENSQLQFCAGVLAGGKDTCQGDSGGPLMSFVNNLWRLDGLTSYGDGCALANKPGVYTRVTSYIGWIKSITQSLETTTRATTRTTTKTTTTTRRTTTTTTTKRTTTTTTTRRPPTTTTTRRPPTTTTTRRPPTITTTKRPATTTTTKKTTIYRKTYPTGTTMRRKLNTASDTTTSPAENIVDQPILNTSNSAKHSTIQSLLIISFFFIISSAYAFFF